MTESQGTITDTYDYDAFGNLIAQSGATPNEHLYAGEQYDANIGFYYLRARYLNPSSGRFHSMDSFEGNKFDPITLHKYLYANNDPANRIDPTGNFADFSVAGFGSISAGIGTLAGISSIQVVSVLAHIGVGLLISGVFRLHGSQCNECYQC